MMGMAKIHRQQKGRRRKMMYDKNTCFTVAGNPVINPLMNKFTEEPELGHTLRPYKKHS